jgi:hypothetical protein
MLRYSWPNRRGALFHLPPRIAFEPSAVAAKEADTLARETRGRVREAWQRSQPAIVSTHRVNYAHLRPASAAAGRAALRGLLKLLVDDGAVFLVDTEVRQLDERAWSIRGIGARGAIVRYYGVPREPIRFPVPAGVTGVELRDGRGGAGIEVGMEEGQGIARLNVGEYLLEWLPRPERAAAQRFVVS